MTKVGIYAILRVNGTVFDGELSQSVLQNWLYRLYVGRVICGVIGAIGAEQHVACQFMVLSSIGTLLIAISMTNTQAWSATLVLSDFSTLIAAAFEFALWLDYLTALGSIKTI